ncbi:MAG: hypothetical protein GF317_06595 [Candidatus Lokiarchaeota archaeon]|nr:hypothetical protein [Candidatus Lokiarchaeota archaeon]MBD3199382.1 hypothetical protein [Candidatus Lokiarchaeota archaeon]
MARKTLSLIFSILLIILGVIVSFFFEGLFFLPVILACPFSCGIWNRNNSPNQQTERSRQRNFTQNEEKPDLKDCPVCGNKISGLNLRFCPECGSKLYMR